MLLKNYDINKKNVVLFLISMLFCFILITFESQKKSIRNEHEQNSVKITFQDLQITYKK